MLRFIAWLARAGTVAANNLQPYHSDSQRYLYLHPEKYPNQIPVLCLPTRCTVFLL
jgi:hypothetical protein